MREKLKNLRKKKKLSQTEMAKILNVHQTAVSQWEKGRTTPDMQTLIKIADYFNVSIDYLLGQEKNTIDTEETLTLEEKQLIEKYRLLDDYGQKAVNHMLDIECERCSAIEKEQQARYVARSGEKETINRSKEETDSSFGKLKPDTSEQF